VPDWLNAIVLGIVEGLTEFIPVSSTGHLLLTKEALGLPDGAWDTFIVMIQLGAILAVMALYFTRLWKVLITLNEPKSQRFVISVLLGSAPAILAGLLLHEVIKTVFFGAMGLICWSLIIGGIVLLFIERLTPTPTKHDAMEFSPLTSLGIGIFQCLSLVPGVSRSGATILGGRFLKADSRSAAEFSFFLAMPIMVGAFALDAWESRASIDMNQAGLIAIGFVVSFISGAVVVKTMLGFVQRHGLAPFGWWRIIAGALGLWFFVWN
jgi:undecaprenyl-diphosphatase